LLRAVVKVALEVLALPAAGLEQARPRTLQLLETSSKLGVQAAVLERDPCCRADGVEKLRLVVERSVVDQGRYMPTVSLDQGGRPAVAGRQLDFPPLEVDVGLEIG
jgi:hypothetical protein